MFFRIFKLITSFLLLSVSDKCKREFFIGINKINITRAKITAKTFIVLEVMQLAAWFMFKGGSFLKKPDIYYAAMYISLLIAMIVYLFIFVKLQNNIPKYDNSIRIVGISFAGVILFWCAGISLLDQLTSGQIIVYTVAIISIAVAPIFEPMALLFIYLTIHAVFLFVMPIFQKSNAALYGNYVNSTAFLIISWVISYMRYKKQVEDFNNKKVVQKSSYELKRVNKELEEANQKLEKLSQTDSLTDIFNRFVFDRKLEEEWDRCRRHFIPLSLIMIDVDFFKDFNDYYGHQAGDECLRKIAGVLSACARRSSDIVARYGGEEFAIILPYLQKEDSLEFAEQLRKKIEGLAIPHKNSSISEHITISLGVHTVIPSASSSIKDFIRTTDKALYEAKRDRNNSVVA